MENAELDVALEELENRLERLRALYEQYFMGIERIEPAIPRKDIDRRIYVLRREKIRNTAKRFKLQTIISRYNTFQQYWQRICREIENGTYKRHVIKAERIAPGQLLTIAARKRLGRNAFEEPAEQPAPQPANASAAAGSVPPAPSVPAPRLQSSVPAPPSVPRPAPGSAPPKAKVLPPPKPGARPAKPTQPERAPTAAAAAPAAAAAKPFESLDLDMDFMGDWDPTSAPSKASRSKAEPSRPFGEALSRPLESPPFAEPPKAPARPAAKPAPPAAPRANLPAPPATAKAPPAPTPPIQKPTPAAAKPPPGDTGLAPQAKLGAAPIARPVAKPAPAPTPAAALTDDRVRELHARLVEAKRQTKDAGMVSVEGLAKSLKATEAKLREQHKNRKIDFDVVIKDGRAVLKPIVR